MTGQPKRRALTARQRLEARAETLEFLVLALLRAGKDEPALQRSVLVSFDIMEKLLEMPEINRSPAYRNQCISLFQDAMALTWDHWELWELPEAGSGPASSLQ